MSQASVGEVTLGAGSALAVIAGPCVIEDESSTLKLAESLKRATGDLGVPFIFKASYDKANRTSGDSFRGPGLIKGLEILARVRTELSVPILTDVHCSRDVAAVAEVVDCIQIPAFLCRQTDLIKAAAGSGRAVNIKRGQFMAPEQMRHAAVKAADSGCKSLMVTERGSCFGYNDLVVDFRAIAIMRGFGYPVVFDATHSVQRPAGQGAASGGDREMVPVLSRAAVAVGVDGLFLEVHPEPDKALSDGPNSIALDDFPGLVAELTALDGFIRSQGV